MREAVENGRLSKSLTPDGKIHSAALADEEWAASTKAEHVPLTGPASPRAATAHASNGLAEARRRREDAQAQLRELELARHRGELIPVKVFEAALARIEDRMRTAFTLCRNRLLAIPTRARHRDPSLTARHVALIDDLVREALVELAQPSEPDGSAG